MNILHRWVARRIHLIRLWQSHILLVWVVTLHKVLKHLKVSFILFVLLIEQINLLEFVVNVVIVHVYNIILLFCFFFKKLVAVQVILLYEFINVWSRFRFYAGFVTYVIYVAQMSSLAVHWSVMGGGCCCLQVWQIPEKLFVVFILIISWTIMEFIAVILEKGLILNFLISIFNFWIGFRWIKQPHFRFDSRFSRWLRNGRGR